MSIENHLRLPQEIFEKVLLYLDLKDILSCSLVCVGWRNAVNSDHVWQALIPACRLEPFSENRGLSSCCVDENWTTLTPLCVGRWRVRNYLARLRENWRGGRYVRVRAGIRNIQTDKTDSGVLLECLEGNSFRIRHISNIPSYVGVLGDAVDRSPSIDESIRCAYIKNNDDSMRPKKLNSLRLHLLRSRIEFLELANSVLVVVHHTNLLQVFTKDSGGGGYTRKLVSLFDEDPLSSIPVPDDFNLCAWYQENGHLCESCWQKTLCDQNGKYFVGIVFSSKDSIRSGSVFHVWDLQSLTKIKEVELPDVGSELIKDVLFLKLHNNVVLVGLCVDARCPHEIRPPRATVWCYNLEKMCYTSAVMTYGYRFGEYDRGARPSVLLTDIMVILCEIRSEAVLLFDFSDGRLLDTVRKPVADRTHFGPGIERPEQRPCCMKVFGNILVFSVANFEPSPVVTVYDISNRSVIERFRVEEETSGVGAVDRSDKIITNLHIRMDDLMIISTSCLKRERPYFEGRMFIRDMKTKAFVCLLPFSRFIPPTLFSNKMLARETYYDPWCILNFW